MSLPSATAETVLNSYLPFGWHLTHLIREDHTSGDFLWQAIATDDEHVATATAESIEWAIATCAENILAETFVGRIFDGIHKQASPSLTAVLDSLKPKLPAITRRL